MKPSSSNDFSTRAVPQGPQELGRPKRGVTAAAVAMAADALLRSGQRPTVEKIRAHLGGGSPNTINPLLDDWWQDLSTRMQATPSKVLERLPEPVLHAAESMWWQSLDTARERVLSDMKADQANVKSKHDDQVLRAQVLDLREQELKEQLRERDSTIAGLQDHVRAFTLLFKKEQAKRESETRRVEAVQAALEALRASIIQMPVRVSAPRRAKAVTKKSVRTQKSKLRLKQRPVTRSVKKIARRVTRRTK